MDVMEPKIMWVEGARYRFFDYDVWTSKNNVAVPYIEELNPQECTNVNKETPQTPKNKTALHYVKKTDSQECNNVNKEAHRMPKNKAAVPYDEKMIPQECTNENKEIPRMPKNRVAVPYVEKTNPQECIDVNKEDPRMSKIKAATSYVEETNPQECTNVNKEAPQVLKTKAVPHVEKVNPQECINVNKEDPRTSKIKAAVPYVKETNSQECTNAIKEAPQVPKNKADVPYIEEINPQERTNVIKEAPQVPKNKATVHYIEETNPQEGTNVIKEAPQAPKNKDTVFYVEETNPQEGTNVNKEGPRMSKIKADVPYVEETHPQECTNVNKEDPRRNIEIQPDANGKYYHSHYIAHRYYPFIVGYRARKLLQLEKETNTTIRIPGKNDACNSVIIGASSEAIVKAIDQINEIIENARKIVEPTHFLSIPMTDETIKANFVKFRDVVLNECGSDTRGVHKRAFQKPEKLHLTLGMLLLVDDKELKAAYAALAEWKKTIMMPTIEKNGPIKIKVEGLDYTNAVPSSANVIYGRVSSENNALQELFGRTTQFFIQKGLMIPDYSCTKLHMKLMNAFADKPYGEPQQICARDVLTAHKDHFFGETVLNVLHLSHRYKLDKNGYFATVAKIGV